MTTIGSDVPLTCTAIGPDSLSNTTVLWRVENDDGTFNNISEGVSAKNYNANTNQFVTMLTINANKGGSITKYGCYHSFSSGLLESVPHIDVFNNGKQQYFF